MATASEKEIKTLLYSCPCNAYKTSLLISYYDKLSHSSHKPFYLKQLCDVVTEKYSISTKNYFRDFKWHIVFFI